LFVCYFHFALLQFRLFDVFGSALKNFLPGKRRQPAVEPKPAAINVMFAIQAGQI